MWDNEEGDDIYVEEIEEEEFDDDEENKFLSY